MHHTRKRLIGMAMLFLALLASISVTEARWSNGDIGFTNMERVCRDGAIVSVAAGSAGANGAVGARRHDNLAALPEPNKAFGGSGTPLPLSDFGPNIVAAPAMRALTITTQDLAREVPVSFGNGAPDITHNYAVVILPWSAPQQPGTPVIVVYHRNDNEDVGIAEEIVADCLIGGTNPQTIPTTALPGGDSAIPSAQLTYQLADWPKYGHLLRDNQPLGLGTRFTTADLVGHPLSYTTNRTPLGDQLPISVVGTELVSHITDPLASLSANNPAISSDGRYVAFESLDSTLVTDDTNTAHDIFVYDRQTKQTSRASLSSSGAQANDSSTAAAISGDGRYVAFQSSATNLVDADTNNSGDVFVRDRQTNQTARISVSSSGVQANDASTDPAISADGRYVAFVSAASNLVSGDIGGHRDVFLHDRQTGETTRISVGAGGAQADGESDSPAISGDGHLIAFHSDATNLLSAGADSNNVDDIFVYNRLTGQTTLASVSSSGAQADASSTAPAISADGSTVAFASIATNLAPINTGGQKNIYLHKQQTGQTIWVSHPLDATVVPDADSDIPSISGDGRFVAFTSLAGNLVGYDAKAFQDIFLYDQQSDAITCLSVITDGSAADGSSTNPAISADGRFTAIESYATNLLPTTIAPIGSIYARYHTTANVVIGRPYQVYSPLTQK